jgi:hypothetical protein
MLGIRRLLTVLAEGLGLPGSVGLVELDLQIDKLRKLRDSYQELPKAPRY